MGLFGGKRENARSVAIPRHGYATLPAVVAPSEAIEDSRTRYGRIRILWGLLMAGLALNLGLTWVLAQTATIEPYVADGGVFGCPVPVLEVMRPRP